MYEIYVARCGNSIDHMTSTYEYSSRKYSDTEVWMKIMR
jgi:hypothetical protein